MKVSAGIKLEYADNTSRVYNVNLSDILSPEQETAAKANIAAINANTGDQFSNFYSTFVSNDGAAVTGITEFSVTETTEEVIYNG